MQCIRSSPILSPVFHGCLAILILAGNSIAAEPLGWGNVWQERMSIGQAQLDEAYNLAKAGKADQALAKIDTIINTKPDNWRPHLLKSAVLVLLKRNDLALQELDTSIRLARKNNVSPELLAELQASKARSCLDAQRYGDARHALQDAVKLQPNSATELNDLAWLLATCPDARVRDPRRSLALAKKACSLDQWSNAFSLDTLAAAYAASGDFANAVKTQQSAVDRLSGDDRSLHASEMQRRLQLYSAHQPYIGG
jgi:tetratricopeptide (TPR) repeat protein